MRTIHALILFPLILLSCTTTDQPGGHVDVPPRPLEQDGAVKIMREALEASFDRPSVTAANIELFDELIDVIREGFYDRRFNGVDLAEFRAAWKERIGATRSKDELHAVMREALKDFRVSHLTVLRGDVFWRFFRPEMNGTESMRLGLDLVSIDGKLFVGDAVAGGAARKAGVQRGDEIVTIGAKPAFKSPWLVDGGSDPLFEPHYEILPTVENPPVVLGIRSASAEEVREITVTAAMMNLVNATEFSVSVIEHEGRHYGYIRIYHFLHDRLLRIFQRAIRSTWVGTDGLIIDLRGRGGSPVLLAHVLASVGGERPRDFHGPVYRDGPVVGLIDASSRSAKEVFAHNLRRDVGATLVGRPTAGAVLGSTFIALSEGTRVLLPVSDPVELSRDGVRIEGNPVKPDVTANIELAYVGGRDDLLNEGLKVIAGKMDANKPSVYEQRQKELREAHPRAPAEKDF